MNFIIDIGNSRTKISVYSPSSELIANSVIENFDIQIIKNLKLQFPSATKAILATTQLLPPNITDDLKLEFARFIELTDEVPIPIKNRYDSPETLGPDRLAAAVGANYLFPSTNILIIDCGTAITFDRVSDKNEYLGGNISPGIIMRFQALHTYTGKLPLIQNTGILTRWGQSTESAVLAGVQNGVLYEVEAYIAHFKKIYKKNKVIFTGGDSKFFESNLKNSFFVHSNLVSTGLNMILEYNA